MRAEVGRCSAAGPCLPPLIVSTNLRPGTSGTESKMLRRRPPLTDSVARAQAHVDLAAEVDEQVGQDVGRRAPGRPGPSAPCRAAARSPARCRRSRLFGQAPAASCGPGADRLMWLWSRIRALRQGDRGAAQVGVPVAGDEGRPELRVLVAEHSTCGRRRPGEKLGPEACSLPQSVGWKGAETGNELKVAGLVGSAPPPEQRPVGREFAAAGPVEGEFLLVDVDVDRADVELGAAEDVRDRVARGWIWAVSGSTKQRHPDDDDAEVEGPGDGRGDHRERERRALVGAGEVGLAARSGSARGRCRP